MDEDLSTKTDTELTALTARWSDLSPGERRKLQVEVRGRMLANQKSRRPVGVRVLRKYGRVVRKSDGSVVVETRVVQMTPRSRPRVSAEQGTPRSLVTFGIGFEQRSKARPQTRPQTLPQGKERAPEPGLPLLPQQMQRTPAVTVSQQQTAPNDP